MELDERSHLTADRAAGPPAPARRSSNARLRAQLHLRHLIGRALVIWIVAYLVLDAWHHHELRSAALATAALVAYLPFVQWMDQVARSMPIVLGTGPAVAIGAVSGMIALSTLTVWFDRIQLSLGSILVITLVVFLGTWLWDVAAVRLGSIPASVVVVGGGPPVDDLLAELETRATGFRVVGVAADRITHGLVERRIEMVPLTEMEELVETTSPALIVVAVDHGRPGVFERLLALAHHERFRIIGLPEFYEVAFGRLPTRALTPAWFMSTLHYYNRPYRQLAKRSFDLVVALVGLAVVALLLPFVALVVKRTSGPLFYRQQRLGEYGREFRIVKFRSMVADAEKVGGAVFAGERDPRVIWGGHLLRRARIDELPQLWNVLRGEMSIVGPRPERPEFLAALAQEVPFWTERNLLKPGLTGWAQIMAGYTSDALGAEEKLSYDLWYLRHRSLMVDAVICVKTFSTVLTGAGAR
ncbi:MAG: exopolysaccharide biosynthesis polyprenyl glycosylphosphotransferase [Gaiellales bacterium]